MQEKYDKCPVCNGEFNTSSDGNSGVIYNCNNEKEIIFAKARRGEIPDYHSFSYTVEFMPGHEARSTTVRWSIQFNLNPKKVVRVMRIPGAHYTSIMDRWGQSILRINVPLEPDFPSLEKLRNKIKTCLNFS